MKKSLSVLWAMLLAVGFLLIATPEASSIKKANTDAIKQVMKEAHNKDGLLKKVMGGEAKTEEKEKLLALYIMLWDAGCPGGDADSWTDKSGALVVAAAKVVAGRDDANDALKAASNCGNCHKVHKKKRIKIGAGNLLGPAERIAAALTGAGEPKYSVKDVMKQAHKDGLLKKVNGGQASEEEKLKLLDLYIAMWAAKPTKGDIVSWKQKSGAVIVAVSKVYLGQDGSVEELKKATNCGACHKVHK